MSARPDDPSRLADATLLEAYRRALLLGQRDLVQLWFQAEVLERYRGQPGYRLIRTDTAGRLTRTGMWSIDYGIVEGREGWPDLIHTGLEAWLRQVPEAEREHWLAYLVTPPASENFMKMQMAPHSCIDDGEVREG